VGDGGLPVGIPGASRGDPGGSAMALDAAGQAAAFPNLLVGNCCLSVQQTPGEEQKRCRSRGRGAGGCPHSDVLAEGVSDRAGRLW